MSSTAKLHVAISHGDGAYKHWSLWVEGPGRENKLVLQILGYSMNYYFEKRNSNARDSEELVELIPLCTVPASQTGSIVERAQNAPVHNQYPGYNCQDYVLELLDDLETVGIIDNEDGTYQKQKKLVKSKQEGLE